MTPAINGSPWRQRCREALVMVSLAVLVAALVYAWDQGRPGATGSVMPVVDDLDLIRMTPHRWLIGVRSATPDGGYGQVLDPVLAARMTTIAAYAVDDHDHVWLRLTVADGEPLIVRITRHTRPYRVAVVAADAWATERISWKEVFVTLPTGN